VGGSAIYTGHTGLSNGVPVSSDPAWGPYDTRRMRHGDSGLVPTGARATHVPPTEHHRNNPAITT
jgi:hypothetical protein